MRLPATGWAVLGLLSFERELSGYDLKKWADASLRFFYWSPAVSQIYGELKRLEELGYVTSRTAPQDELRNKRVYRITPAGREALEQWARTAPVEPPVLKHGVALRVWLGHLVGRDDLDAVLDQHGQHCDQMLAEIGHDREHADTEPDFAYPSVVLKWSERYWESERRLVDELRQDLAQLAKSTKVKRVRA